ncbi:MAG: hypothetical protein ABFD92_02475 [Planctomycetaceae bacterium]|nr:hypothetical protein [Planctomycetaceae bacterium]
MAKQMILCCVSGLVLLTLAGAAAAGPHCCPIIVEDVKLIKEDQLKPNATFHLPVPILGKSTHRTRSRPSVVMMSVHLPENYDPKKAHPVVVHLGGGVDQRKFIGRWTSITGNKDFIILLAEYTSRLDSGPRNAAQMLRILAAATPVKYGAVVLAGISSGSWGMNTNFADQFYTRGFMDPWDGFIFIEGNNNKHITVTAEKLRGRPVFFVGGNSGGARAIQLKSHEAVKAAGGDSTFFDEVSGYGDFPHTCDKPIMEWLKTKILDKQAKYDAFDKKVADAGDKPDALLALLKEPLHYWHAKLNCLTRYIELARKETDAAKRTAMLEKLKTIANLPMTNGGPSQDAMVWLSQQKGFDTFVKTTLAKHNPFIDPVVDPKNGYGPNVDFRAR